MKEAQIEREIMDFLKMIGFSVYRLSQGYRKERGGTRQTPGIPDLYMIGHGFGAWVEVKGPKGKLRASQEEFRDTAAEHGVDWHCWNDVRQAWDWAVELGIVEESVTQY